MRHNALKTFDGKAAATTDQIPAAGPALSNTAPVALAAAASAGSSSDAARADHVHPATGLVKSTEKGAANGVAELGADGKVPASMLPTIPAPGPALSNTAPVALAATAAAGSSTDAARADHAHPTTGLVLANEKGSASGVATLGADGKVPAGQLPAVTPSITAAEVRKIAMLQAIIFG